MGKIVVYSGGFNPPTIAHEKLLVAALDGVGADTGIYVPSNDALVTKEMSKTDWPQEVLSEKTRIAMLEAVCEEDARFAVDQGEFSYKGTSSNCLDTMARIHKKHPDAEALYFLFDGDTLKVLTKWKCFREFCESNYKVIVFMREGADPTAEIEKTKGLREVRDAFIILPAVPGIEGISSTAVRDAIRTGDEESARAMLRPEVFRLLQGSPIHKETAITSFRGKYRFLSNFYAAQVTFEGLTYPCSEAAFQAMKSLDTDDRIPFTKEKNPVTVKRMGKKVKLRSDWEYVKVEIMEKIVRAKFMQHPELTEQLIATGDIPIMEGNSWHDTFWGVDAATGKGKNHLGKILMKIRAEVGGSETIPQPLEIPGVEKEYVPGMRILHPIFGEGTVTAVTGEGKTQIVDVVFSEAGKKQLSVTWVEKNCRIS